MAEKPPIVGCRTTAGDHKGAQPPYRADKRAERAMSARHLKKDTNFVFPWAFEAAVSQPSSSQITSVICN